MEINQSLKSLTLVILCSRNGYENYFCNQLLKMIMSKQISCPHLRSCLDTMRRSQLPVLLSKDKHIHRYFLRIGLVICSCPGLIVFIALTSSRACILLQGDVGESWKELTCPLFSTGVSSRAFSMLRGSHTLSPSYAPQSQPRTCCF